MISTPEKDKQIHLSVCITGKRHENLENKEPPRIVTDDNVKMIIYCFEYLEHLQDLKKQSLLPGQDYTTTMQGCLRMLLKLNGFCTACFKFSANPAVQLPLQ